MSELETDDGEGNDAKARTTQQSSSRLRLLRHYDIGLLTGAFLILGFILVAVLGPVLAPHPPNAVDLANALQSPSTEYWLGTDRYGRDVWSRILWGALTSLIVAISVGGLSLGFGVVLGTLAGYFGGWVDRILLFLINILLAFPGFILALAFVAARGASLGNVVAAVTIAYTPRVAIVMRASVLSCRPRAYVEAAEVLGFKPFRIILRHVLPNALPPVLIVAAVSAAFAVIAEAGLSFLGLGVQPPTATWGGIITDGRGFLTSHPLLTVAPGVAIALVVIGLNLLSDGLRDALDPQLSTKLL